MSLAYPAWLRGPLCTSSVAPIPSSSGRARGVVQAGAGGSIGAYGGGGRRGGKRQGAEHGASRPPAVPRDAGRSSEREALKTGATRSREGIEAKLSAYRRTLRAGDDADGDVAVAESSELLGLDTLGEDPFSNLVELPEQDFDLEDLLGSSPSPVPSAPPPRRNDGPGRRPRRLRSSVSAATDKEGRRRPRMRGRRQAAWGAAGEGTGGWQGEYREDASTFNDKVARRRRSIQDDSAFSTYMEEMGAVDLLSKEEEIRLSGWLQQALEIRRAQEALEASLDRPPTYEEIAADAGFADADEMAMVWERGYRAKRQLMLANLKLVVSIAKKYTGGATGLTLHDLCQEGALGLGTGTEKFDASKGFRFSTYSYYWIRSSVQNAVARNGHPVATPRRVYEQLGKLAKARRAHAEAFGQESKPGVGEISELSGMSPKVVEKLLHQQKVFLSLEGINSSPDGDGGGADQGGFERVMGDEGKAAVTDTVDAGLAQEAIHGVISSKLTPREAAVLRMRYGLDGCSAVSVGTVGRRLGIAANTVREVESIGLNALMSDDEILAQMEAYLYLYT